MDPNLHPRRNPSSLRPNNMVESNVNMLDVKGTGKGKGGPSGGCSGSSGKGGRRGGKSGKGKGGRQRQGRRAGAYTQGQNGAAGGQVCARDFYVACFIYIYI